uniref:Putative lipocalin-2 1 n=1 Tax=Ixodes ricinus TaxID=34613 RepID=V5H2A2_IXORI
MKLVSPCIQWCILATIIDATLAERRIDEEEKYWPHQDIRQALDNADKKSWMFYRTLRSTDRAEHKCVYAEVKEKDAEENVYKFLQRYIKGDGTKVSFFYFREQTLFASTYKTEHPEHKKRGKDNAMLVTKTKDSKTGRNYSLIYSDYKCCDILRSLADENGAACELYLHDNCVSQDVPKSCAAMYGNACGKGDDYKHQVYYKSCKNETDVTTKPTPEGPETPEEATTTSTLPPGC